MPGGPPMHPGAAAHGDRAEAAVRRRFVAARQGDERAIAAFDALFYHNSCISPTYRIGAQIYGVAQGTGALTVERMEFRHDALVDANPSTIYEVALLARGSGVVTMLDSLVSHSRGSGVVMEVDDSGVLRFGQNTIADNAVPSKMLNQGSLTAAVYDNIFWNPATPGVANATFDGAFALAGN